MELTSMRTLLLAILISLTSACFATVEPVPVVAVAPAPAGWITLGERTVHGRVDRDIIHVGRVNGRFRKLQFVVEHAPLEMFDVIVVMGDGSMFRVPTRLIFQPGQSRTIDLPGDLRVVRRVEFRYGNLPGAGRARVLLLGSS
jgi:hypothetical protein